MAIKIDYDNCEFTAACITVCPEDVFAEQPGKIVVQNVRACTECWICVDHCSAGAIDMD